MTAITLTTDFGTADGYVGSMKGVSTAIEPRATIHDLTHQIPAQGVNAAAYALYRAVPYCPPGSVHCVVIDPGVGSRRRAIAARAERDQYLVGPDSGVFTLFCPPFSDSEPEAVELTETRWWRDPGATSSTFHGRDIFAPVAAHLARMLQEGSADLSVFGPPARDLRCFDLPTPVEEGQTTGPNPETRSVVVQRGGNLATHTFVREVDQPRWLELGVIKPAIEEGTAKK